MRQNCFQKYYTLHMQKYKEWNTVTKETTLENNNKPVTGDNCIYNRWITIGIHIRYPASHWCIIIITENNLINSMTETFGLNKSNVTFWILWWQTIFIQNGCVILRCRNRHLKLYTSFTYASFKPQWNFK